MPTRKHDCPKSEYIVTYVKRTYNERIVNSRLYVFLVLGRKFIYNARIVLHIFAADLRGSGLLI